MCWSLSQTCIIGLVSQTLNSVINQREPSIYLTRRGLRGRGVGNTDHQGVRRGWVRQRGDNCIYLAATGLLRIVLTSANFSVIKLGCTALKILQNKGSIAYSMAS